jgi:hypothetical protein
MQLFKCCHPLLGQFLGGKFACDFTSQACHLLPFNPYSLLTLAFLLPLSCQSVLASLSVPPRSLDPAAPSLWCLLLTSLVTPRPPAVHLMLQYSLETILANVSSVPIITRADDGHSVPSPLPSLLLAHSDSWLVLQTLFAFLLLQQAPVHSFSDAFTSCLSSTPCSTVHSKFHNEYVSVSLQGKQCT